MGATLAIFSSWALLRALQSPQGRYRDWLLYAVLALLFLYTHNMALFSVAAQAIFIAGLSAWPFWFSRFFCGPSETRLPGLL